MKTYKDMSPQERKHANEDAKKPMNQKKPNSMGRYFTGADGGSQIGFNYKRRGKKKKR